MANYCVLRWQMEALFLVVVRLYDTEAFTDDKLALPNMANRQVFRFRMETLVVVLVRLYDKQASPQGQPVHPQVADGDTHPDSC